MNVGIIGYGSMGKMLLEKFVESKVVGSDELFISNRSIEKIECFPEKYNICKSNSELAAVSDVIFICVRPVDIKIVLEEIAAYISESSLIVSLNGSISFELIEKVIKHKIAKAIPSVTAEINRSQTLVCFNDKVMESDKQILSDLLKCIGNVIELPENEMGMGSELVSCMPGFIASIFDVICESAQKHTSIPQEQIINMVLNTLCATGDLMLENDMSFSDVVSRVATKGGITEVGSKVIYEKLPDVTDEMFIRTLEKRRMTAEKAKEIF
ncbi:MAG: NAD(P)-binding domain-containing protein [Lachnospiraceae bacterium]|nr:NAD(P)-binding domain-containing protein [Lachnospiraceae bacterium]